MNQNGGDEFDSSTLARDLIGRLISESRKSDRFVGYLEKNGVLVNQGDGVCTCGLDRTFVRFACGTRDEMEYAKRVIKRYVGACG